MGEGHTKVGGGKHGTYTLGADRRGRVTGRFQSEISWEIDLPINSLFFFFFSFFELAVRALVVTCPMAW